MSYIIKKNGEEFASSAKNQGLAQELDIEERIYLWLRKKQIFPADGKANVPKLDASGENIRFSPNKIQRKPLEMLEKRNLKHLNLKLNITPNEKTAN